MCLSEFVEYAVDKMKCSADTSLCLLLYSINSVLVFPGLTGIKIDPPTVNLESGMETEVSCLTRLGAEPPTVEWLQENKTVSTTEFVTVNDHALTLKYSTELNGAEFECQVNEFRESLEVFIGMCDMLHPLLYLCEFLLHLCSKSV